MRNSTLKDREPKYGNYASRANISQTIKDAFVLGDNWRTMSADKRESLEMIASKISRILNGDAGLKDSWHDIAGYAKLVEETLDDPVDAK